MPAEDRVGLGEHAFLYYSRSFLNNNNNKHNNKKIFFPTPTLYSFRQFPASHTFFMHPARLFVQAGNTRKRGLWVDLPRKVYVTTSLKRHRKMMIFLRHLFLRFESARKGKCFHCLTRPVPTPHPQQKKGGRCHQCFQTGAAICDP